MWLNGAGCKGYVRGSCVWQSPVPNQYEDNDLSAQSVHNALVCSRELRRPSFRSSNRQRERKVLRAHCRSGGEKKTKQNTLCWYWFLRSWSCDMFPHCHHAAASSKASGFGKAECSRCEGPQSCWWRGRIWFVQSQQNDSKAVVKHGWPCGAQRCHPGTGWAAGCLSTHCTTAPICSGRFSSLPRGPQFHTEQGAPTGWNN